MNYFFLQIGHEKTCGTWMNIETLLNIIKYYNLYIWLVVLTILKNMKVS